jgi:outer membrane protein
LFFLPAAPGSRSTGGASRGDSRVKPAAPPGRTESCLRCHIPLPRIRCWKLGLLFALIFSFAPSILAETRPNTDLPVLSVDDAVKIALADNRTLKIVSLNLDVHKEKLAADKTRRLPTFNTYAFGSELLSPISYFIPQGQFGCCYPGIGPIPAQDTYLTTPSKPTATVLASASQPLLQLYKINLYLRGQKLSVEQAELQLVEQKQTVVDQVRQAFYKVVQIDNQMASTEASIKQYQELERITAQYVSQQVALQSDSLEVRTKLAQEQLSLLKLQNQQQTAKETLNDLLGRDINTQFNTAAVAPVSADEMDLASAQAKALQNNPKVKEGEITVKQADNARALAKSQYLPDLSFSLQYTSPIGYTFVPTNIANAGFEFRWEPFDWGRRKHDVNEKTINVVQSKLELQNTRAKILINVGDQFRALQEARAAVLVAQAAQTSSREKLREVTWQYGQQTKLLREVLQQQAAVDKANSDYDDAVAEFWSAKASFEKAIGEE